MHLGHLGHRLFRGAAGSVLLLVLAAGTVAAQKKSSNATLLGRVIDTVGTALPGAEVVIALARDSTVTKTATSDAQGEVAIRDLPAGGPYVLLARKIGYGAARGTDIYLKAKDTLRVDFELPAVGVTLPTITVAGRRGSANVLTAGEIDSKQNPDALSAIAWKRPYMLGDPDRCRAPDPPPWPTPANTGTGRRPWLNSSRFYDVFNPPYSPYVQRVYVNGIRIDIPGQSPLMALHDVPSSQIAEMRYVDCTEISDAWPYSIYIVLKAPSREVQDSILRSITGRDPKHD
jgi:hypothetical protein